MSLILCALEKIGGIRRIIVISAAHAEVMGTIQTVTGCWVDKNECLVVFLAVMDVGRFQGLGLDSLS